MMIREVMSWVQKLATFIGGFMDAKRLRSTDVARIYGQTLWVFAGFFGIVSVFLFLKFLSQHSKTLASASLVLVTVSVVLLIVGGRAVYDSGEGWLGWKKVLLGLFYSSLITTLVCITCVLVFG